MLESRYDVVIVGAGPAGLIAAHDLARSGFAVLVPDIPSFRELRPSPRSALTSSPATVVLPVPPSWAIRLRLFFGLR